MIRCIPVVSLLLAMSPQAWSQPKIIAVVNAASFQEGLPWGGALATAYVLGLAGLKPGTYIAPSGQSLPYSLGGISVEVDGTRAPILSVFVPSDSSANAQVSFQVPTEANAGLWGGGLTISGGYIEVNEALLTDAAAGIALGLPEWGGFFAGSNGYAAALHASDSSLVTTQNPAHPGETIIAYADDFFLTWPPPPIGLPAPQHYFFQLYSYPSVRDPGYLFLQAYPQPTLCPFPSNAATCTLSIATTPAVQIAFEGLAQGQVGIEEIDFVVPSSQKPGNWALFFNATSCPDGSGVPGTCNIPFGNNVSTTSSPYVLLPVN